VALDLERNNWSTLLQDKVSEFVEVLLVLEFAELIQFVKNEEANFENIQNSKRTFTSFSFHFFLSRNSNILSFSLFLIQLSEEGFEKIVNSFNAAWKRGSFLLFLFLSFSNESQINQNKK